MLKTMTVLLLAIALTFALAACEDDPKETKTEAAPKDDGSEPEPEPTPVPTATILCDTETALINAAGYTLYEGTGCPIADPIDAAELTDQQDDAVDVYAMPWAFPYMGASYSDITVATNGLIWLGSQPTLSFTWQLDLATGDYPPPPNPSLGSGLPFMAAWNLDLTSASCTSPTCEGVRVQAKTNPDRVVVNWLTEAFDQQGSSLPNDLSVILFPTGDILFVYYSFLSDNPDATDLCAAGETTDINGYCGDFGSGITKADGGTFIALTNTVGAPVWTLASKAYLFHPN